MHRLLKNRVAVILGMMVIAGVVLAAAGGSQSVWAATTKPGQTCVTCHQMTTPGMVTDWKLSKHAKKGVGCETCHGTAHTSAADAAKAGLAGPEVCGQCHESRVKEFKAGKHALAWKAATNMPNFPHISRVQMEGGKGCGGCHKFGLKDEKEMNILKAAGSASQSGSCDACHTRHTFSKTESRQPQACQTCHQGDDHPQWTIYSYSKHGVRAMLKQVGALPKNAGAPTCQDCHMPKGDHAVKTAWGFFGLRLPLPDDPAWAADRVTIFQAMGLFGMDGKPTPVMEGAKALDLFRFTNEDWQKERDKMTKICAECHAMSFVKAEFAKGDSLLRDADKLMAEGIRIVADLYKDGVVKKPEAYPAPFPVILTFHEAPNPAEAKLFEMFLDHRPLMFMGAFHNNPEYPIWYGYAEMMADLYEIKKEAAELRKEKH
jgi:hydroxylamine dehydrogenase